MKDTNIKNKEYRKQRYITIEQFMKRKIVKDILGDSYILSNIQQQRLQKVLNSYSDYDLFYKEHARNVSFMILYNTNNYVGRLRRLLNLSQNHISPISKYSYVLRCGKKEGVQKYEITKEKHNNNFPSKVAYWLRLGYSEEEAKEQVRKSNLSKSKKAGEKLKGKSDFTCRSVKYWLRLGYSEEEAKEQVKRVQGTFTLENCMKKYGKEDGKKIWEERQKKWQDTLNSKTDEEKIEITLKKGHSIESYIANGYSEEEATKLSIAYYGKRRNYSMISQNCFEKLEQMYSGDFYYKLKNYEKQFNGKNIDCYETNSKIVIEFYGDYWHCRKRFYEDDFIRYNELAKDVRKKDEERLKLILQSDKVNDIIIIWESDFRKHPTLCIQKLCEKMENLNGTRNNCKRIEEIIL